MLLALQVLRVLRETGSEEWEMRRWEYVRYGQMLTQTQGLWHRRARNRRVQKGTMGGRARLSALIYLDTMLCRPGGA